MSIFTKAWSVLKDARRVVAVVADVGDAVTEILGIGSKPLKKLIEAARKFDRAADVVEGAAGESKPK